MPAIYITTHFDVDFHSISVQRRRTQNGSRSNRRTGYRNYSRQFVFDFLPIEKELRKCCDNVAPNLVEVRILAAKQVEFDCNPSVLLGNTFSTKRLRKKGL